MKAARRRGMCRLKMKNVGAGDLSSACRVADAGSLASWDGGEWLCRSTETLWSFNQFQLQASLPSTLMNMETWSPNRQSGMLS